MPNTTEKERRRGQTRQIEGEVKVKRDIWDEGKRINKTEGKKGGELYASGRPRDIVWGFSRILSVMECFAGQW